MASLKIYEELLTNPLLAIVFGLQGGKTVEFNPYS